MLNHTGELNAAFWCTRRCLSSAAERLGLASSTREPSRVPHSVIRVGDAVDDLAQRPLAGSAGPRVPRKYFWERMFVAFTDHVVGTSTPRCSNATEPSR
jgi:hypothetical protein